MQQYIEFLERHSLERHFYCRTNDPTHLVEWEVYWRHALNEQCCWGVKRVSEPVWQWYAGNEVMEVLQKGGADLSIVESEMLANIKSMVVYSHLVLEESKQLLGEGIIGEAMMEYHAFSDALVETLRHYVPVTEVDKAKAKHRKRASLHLVTS